MKNMAGWIVCAGMMLAGLGFAGAANAASLCAANENAIFSCTLGKKTASLCGSKDLGPGKGYLYYAYGNLGAIELSTPEKTLAGRVNVMRGSLSYGDYVRIRNGDYSYYLWEEGKHEEVQGVTVKKGNKTISSRECPQSKNTMGPNRWGPIYNAKLKDDDSDFSPQ